MRLIFGDKIKTQQHEGELPRPENSNSIPLIILDYLGSEISK